MKNIKLLRTIVLVIFAFTLLWFLGDNIIIITALIFEKDILQLGHFSTEKVSLTLKALIIIKLLAVSLFIYGAYFLIKIIRLKNLTDFFNNTTFKLLNKAGKCIIVSNIIGFLLSFSIFFVDMKYFVYFNTDSRYLSLLMLVFGFFLILFSKVLIEGKHLKQENDLTI